MLEVASEYDESQKHKNISCIFKQLIKEAEQTEAESLLDQGNADLGD